MLGLKIIKNARLRRIDHDFRDGFEILAAFSPNHPNPDQAIRSLLPEPKPR